MSYIEIEDLDVLGYTNIPATIELADICESACAIADNFCMQSLGETTDEEFLDIKSNQCPYGSIFPSFLPVTQINTLQTFLGISNFLDIPKEECLIDNRAGFILISSCYSGKVKIDYNHGYKIIPADVKRAIISIAGNLISDYIRRTQFDLEGVSEITDDKQKVKFFNTVDDVDIPESAKKILLKYKRVR